MFLRQPVASFGGMAARLALLWGPAAAAQLRVGSGRTSGPSKETTVTCTAATRVLGATHPPTLYAPGIKQPGREASADIKNTWIHGVASNQWGSVAASALSGSLYSSIYS